MIHPEYKSLIDVLDRKLFNIPEYQRHYSWQGKQRSDLFDDIRALQEKQERFDERSHFMATVVCLKTGTKKQLGSNTFDDYDIVDGQQRLTTLIVLLKAISLKLKSDGQLDEAKDVDKLLVKDDGRLIILQNNHDNHLILRYYLEYGSKPEADTIKTAADHNLNQAIKECEKFVNAQSDVIKLLALVKHSLNFIFMSLEDKGAVYTIFEVLNSRGLDVDWLDKCKSLLMGLLYEYADENSFSRLSDELHDCWTQVYREIGLQAIQGHEIVQFAATLKTESNAGSPLSAEEALKHFKDDCMKPEENESKVRRIIENTNWIKEITSCLSKLHAEKRRNAVTEITQARLLAIAIMLRKDLDENERERLLEQWERTTFRIYGIYRNDARIKRGDYVRVAKKIARKETNETELLSLIAEIGKEYPVQSINAEFMKSDFYNERQKELRYFFFRYEEYLAKLNGSQLNQIIWNEIWNASLNNTIEHILPQDKSKSCWNNFTDSQHKDLVHSIGNLSLLSPSLNREAWNNCFNDKKETYKKTKMLLFDEIIFTNNAERVSWDENAIIERRQNLINFALEQWKDL